MEDKEYIIVNGKKMTLQEFEDYKKSLDKSIRLIENSPNNYSTRLYD
jgi:hypothetical protein